MIEDKQLLIVGGTKRNIGKTSLIERIIKKFSSDYDIVAFKIKTIYPNDTFFHGTDTNPLSADEKFRLIEEKNANGNEDTNRMLKAGAKKVFKIKTKANYISYAYEELKNKINNNSLLICESNTLRKTVNPSIYLFVKEANSNDMKPSAKEVIKFANKIILTDGKNHDFNIEEICVKNNMWLLK
ncbi:MAG: hypothetical protein GXO49_04480 [Chlorobi bacterium]|nr:hypothetical protein [Chlorobiota bacterium]